MPAAASPIRFRCPSCRKRLSADLQSVGAEAPCPSCGTTIQVPAPNNDARNGRAIINGLALFGILIAVGFTQDAIEEAQSRPEPPPESTSEPAFPEDLSPNAAAPAPVDTPAGGETAADSTLVLRLPRSGTTDSPTEKSRETAAKAEADKRADGERKERENKEWIASLNAKDREPPKDDNDPFGEKRPARPAAGPDAEAKDLVTARAQLAAVTAEIEAERARWQDAENTIRALTLNRTKPVVEGSDAYWKCVEADKIIADVKTGAPALKARKASLEALVAELE